mgnify:CR=1 FL=1
MESKNNLESILQPVIAVAKKAGSFIAKERKAFTMLELVFVIVVIGILASLALPRIERDLRQEAADNILAAIRYTQHLALNDNKTDPNDANWQKKFWQIRFESDGNGGLLYKVGSNEDNGTNIDKAEAAIDPVNGKYMFASNTTLQSDESPNVLLGKKYGVGTIFLSQDPIKAARAKTR